MKHWTDPNLFAAIVDDEPGRERTEIEVFYLEQTGVDIAQAIQRQRYKRLQDDLFKRLAKGTLLSSAVDNTTDPSHPRSLIHPSLYDDDAISYDIHRRAVIACGRTLWNVEIFEPNEIPTNVTRYPNWLAQYSDQAPGDEAPRNVGTADGAAFRHDPTYEHVWIGDREFSLTSLQGRIVRELHQAAVSGQPWMKIAQLHDAVAFEAHALHQVFKRMPSWRELIRSDRRGNYRLNL